MKKVRTRLSRDLRKKPEPVEAAAPAADEELEEFGRVVRVKKHAGKPMPVEDAIMEMNLLGHNFYMFINEETGNAATVYRRNDGDCGLIELENL